MGLSSLGLAMDCFPQYSENGCTPKVSFGATLELPAGTAPTVFIQKYMPGLTLGIFSGTCTGSLDTVLECTDPGHDGTFVARRVGTKIAATFDGDAAAPELWKCRR
jgi:hypothetical protein